jgi:hypothetical protein
MNKFEAIQEKLIQVFSDKFETIAQIETNPNSEIYIVDYQGQSYIIVDIQLSYSQCSIIQNNHEKTSIYSFKKHQHHYLFLSRTIYLNLRSSQKFA